MPHTSALNFASAEPDERDLKGVFVAGKFVSSIGIALSAVWAPAAAFAAEGQPTPGEIGMQDSVTPIADSIHVFHNGILLWTTILVSLLVLVLLAIIVIRFNKRANPTPARFTHNTLIEVAWTALPVIILVVIAIPSFAILTDQLTMPDGQRKYLGPNIFSFGSVDVPAPAVTVKVTGSQWYWTYEYVNEQKSFDSTLLDEETRLAQTPVQPRLLAVNNMLIVPVNATVRVQVTAADVIHAFAVPSFGIIADAVPGRLNETWFNARKEGVFYGQCRELCGKDHAYMPIAVRVVSAEAYAAWMAALQNGSVADANATLPPVSAAPAA
jgi:cytochrome c oxidase subunit 2